MPQKLTSDQIRTTCLAILNRSRTATVREVVVELRAQYGVSGRRERVNHILRDVVKQWRAAPLRLEDPDIASLRQQLSEALRRAHRAEELERSHQDFWAGRYAEKVEELASLIRPPPAAGPSPEQYLRLYRRAAQLRDRLALYEEVGPVLPVLDAASRE